MLREEAVWELVVAGGESTGEEDDEEDEGGEERGGPTDTGVKKGGGLECEVTVAEEGVEAGESAEVVGVWSEGMEGF